MTENITLLVFVINTVPVALWELLSEHPSLISGYLHRLSVGLPFISAHPPSDNENQLKLYRRKNRTVMLDRLIEIVDAGTWEGKIEE